MIYVSWNIIFLDVDVESIYWMEFQTGDLQSASFNVSDVKRIISTNVTSRNLNIDIDGDFIFYTNYQKIMKINKSSGQNPTVVHTDTERIYAVLFYKQEGKNIFNTVKWNEFQTSTAHNVMI